MDNVLHDVTAHRCQSHHRAYHVTSRVSVHLDLLHCFICKTFAESTQFSHVTVNGIASVADFQVLNLDCLPAAQSAVTTTHPPDTVSSASVEFLRKTKAKTPTPESPGLTPSVSCFCHNQLKCLELHSRVGHGLIILDVISIPELEPKFQR